MRFYSYYEQKSPESVAEFVRSQHSGQLLTQRPGGVNIGIFNHVLENEKVFLHLQKDDEQLKDLAQNPECQFVVHEFLAMIPSYWVEVHNGGAATSYYRYVEYSCRARVMEDGELVEGLKTMMRHYQPEGKFEPIAHEAKLYKASLAQIRGLELTMLGCRTKWKLGQNRPIETRQKVLQHLYERGLAGDLVCAKLIEEELG